MTGPALARDAAERAARESYGKLLAYLARRSGAIEDAEDALSGAFATALERWPLDGVPRAPEAWLLVAARHRFLDRVRGDGRAANLHGRLAAAAREAQDDFDRSPELGDDRLGLMFACAHPAIDASVRAPLMLQAVLGLDAARIASAFLVAPAAMGQRLVRAKQKISATRIPLRVPGADELPERLDAVLAAIYAAYAGGWDDPGGVDSRTRGLAIEAVWLGRLLARIAPNEPEVNGLLALMLYTSARTAARRNADGAFVALERQDVALWDASAIYEGEALLRSAFAARRIGRFQLEAAIQSAHVVRLIGREADWAAIVTLYDDLFRLTGSPVVALNRAVAVGRSSGPAAGIDALGKLPATREWIRINRIGPRARICCCAPASMRKRAHRSRARSASPSTPRFVAISRNAWRVQRAILDGDVVFAAARSALAFNWAKVGMSKAVQLQAYGGVDRLTIIAVPKPAPKAAEVLVRVVAAGTNPGEIAIREGYLKDMFPMAFPFGQGTDFAGHVEAVGADVRDFAVGDDVLGWVENRSAHAEYVVAEANKLIAKPPALDWYRAGSLFVAGTTAFAAVRAVDLKDGDVVAISGAAGGVGSLAVQFAVRSGARVIGIASPDSAEFVRSVGAEHVAYGDGLEQRLREIAPNGIDAWIDLFGNGYVDLAIKLGIAKERINTIIDFAAVGKYHVKGEGSAEAGDAETLAYLASLIAWGDVLFPIAAIYPFASVHDAYRELGERKSHGKVVLAMDARMTRPLHPKREVLAPA